MYNICLLVIRIFSNYITTQNLTTTIKYGEIYILTFMIHCPHNIKRLLIAFVSIFFVIFFFNPTSTHAQSSQLYSPEEVVVKFRPQTKMLERLQTHERIGAQVKRELSKINVDVVRVPHGRVKDFVAVYKRLPSVEYAEPNFIAKKLVLSNDPSLSNQWGMYKIQAAGNSASAWDITSGSSSVRIAILDTGIEESHQDLQGKVVASVNFSDSPTSQDVDGHGTHVAGIAAAATNNNTGVGGVGYQTSLMNVKVLGDAGWGYYDWITNGILWATDNGAKVINLSLGAPYSSQALENAINYAWSKGVVVVAAAGNDGKVDPSYPAYYSNAIAVAAVDQNDQKASWSNYGSWVDVAGPGVSILSTFKGNSYAYYSGTSMATPFTSGVAALVWAKGSCQTNTCVRQAVESSADTINGTGTLWNFGRLNALKAVEYTVDTPISTVTPTPTSAPSPTPTSVQSLPAMTAENISMWYTSSGSTRYIYTKIKVVNTATRSPVQGVNVRLTLTEPTGGSQLYSRTTNKRGEVTFKRRSKVKGVYTSIITSLSKSGYSYSPTTTSSNLTVN